jgi:transposase-like protein
MPEVQRLSAAGRADIKRQAVDQAVKHGRSVAAVAKEFGVCASTISNWVREAGVSLQERPRPNVKVSHQLRAQAVEQIAGGRNATDVAEELGVTAAAVYRWLRLVGVHKPKHSHRSKTVRYSAAFKSDAVRRVADGGGIQSVSVALGVNHQSLRDWVRGGLA